MLIYVDVDGVCANLNVAWLNAYNEQYHDNLKPEDLNNGWDMVQYVKPECGSKIYEYLENPSLYDNVPEVYAALDGVKMLRALGHRIVFATSSVNGLSGRKQRWLLDHGFLIPEKQAGAMHSDYIEIHDKSLLLGDVLVDDGEHNITKFKGYGILFHQEHNKNSKWPVIASNWEDVVRKLSQDVIPIGTHQVEIRCPIQAREFRQIVDTMYVTHLRKNADYSPANIKATGVNGVFTRLWDKVARLVNLTGYTVDVVDEYNIGEVLFYKMARLLWMSGMFVKMTIKKTGLLKAPLNESIEDTLMDMAIYAIIALLLRRKAWGR